MFLNQGKFLGLNLPSIQSIETTTPLSHTFKSAVIINSEIRHDSFVDTEMDSFEHNAVAEAEPSSKEVTTKADSPKFLTEVVPILNRYESATKTSDVGVIPKATRRTRSTARNDPEEILSPGGYHHLHITLNSAILHFKMQENYLM